MGNPSMQNWRNLEQFFLQASMDLKDFTKLYPNLSRDQIAKVAGCSIDTVNHWFCGDRSPTAAHKLRMAIAHWVWTQEDAEPTLFQELRQIRTKAKDLDKDS